MSLFDVVSWWSWLVGGIGLAGAIALGALAIFGTPGLIAVVGERLAKLIGELLNTTIGLVLVVAACAWFGSYLVTAHQAKAECQEIVARMKLRAEQVRKARDDEIAAAIEAKYGPEIVALKAREAALQQQVTDNAAKPTAAPGCKLDDRALRLRRKPR